MSNPDIDYTKTRFPYSDAPQKPFDHSKSAGGGWANQGPGCNCEGCKNRTKETDALKEAEAQADCDYRAEQERLAELPQEDQDKAFWAKFGMSGPPPRERPRYVSRPLLTPRGEE